MKSEFVWSAAQPAQFPTDGLPEIAFLGRSNVGKSSLLNCLTGQKKLAFTSSTPGRTQTINFYRILESPSLPRGTLHFVDLPGYGFARAPKAVTLEWKTLVDSYLTDRPQLKLSILILDSRRGLMDMDFELKCWLEVQALQYLVVATKVDKLNQSEYQRGLAALRKEGIEPLPFSAITGRGVREIWQAITKTLNP